MPQSELLLPPSPSPPTPDLQLSERSWQLPMYSSYCLHRSLDCRPWLDISHLAKGTEKYPTWPQPCPSADALWSGTCGGPRPPSPTTWKTDPCSSPSASANWKREKVPRLTWWMFEKACQHQKWHFISHTYIRLMPATKVVVFHLCRLFISTGPGIHYRLKEERHDGHLKTKPRLLTIWESLKIFPPYGVQHFASAWDIDAAVLWVYHGCKPIRQWHVYWVILNVCLQGFVTAVSITARNSLFDAQQSTFEHLGTF